MEVDLQHWFVLAIGFYVKQIPAPVNNRPSQAGYNFQLCTLSENIKLICMSISSFLACFAVNAN
jgi:hypothetical protein